jgi:hypothetical protein
MIELNKASTNGTIQAGAIYFLSCFPLSSAQVRAAMLCSWLTNFAGLS